MSAPGAPSTEFASRVAPAQGIREDIGFIETPRGRIFGSLHLPLTPTGAAVLICCPVGAEFDKNYRREVLLARSLATRGLAVGRFHYIGTGQSDGEPEDLTFGRMLDDARAFMACLAERGRAERLAVFGTRLGGMVAAALTAEASGVPLVLWHPTLDGETYFKEVFRIRFMAELRSGGGHSSRESLFAELRQQGWLDVIGYTIGSSFYDSVVDLRLDAVAGTTPRAALLCQLGPDRSAQAAYGEIVGRWREWGWDAEHRIVEERESWWFGDHRRGRGELLTVTADHVERLLLHEGGGS